MYSTNLLSGLEIHHFVYLEKRSLSCIQLTLLRNTVLLEPALAPTTKAKCCSRARLNCVVAVLNTDYIAFR
jgi:hypothetical protein